MRSQARAGTSSETRLSSETVPCTLPDGAIGVPPSHLVGEGPVRFAQCAHDAFAAASAGLRHRPQRARRKTKKRATTRRRRTTRTTRRTTTTTTWCAPTILQRPSSLHPPFVQPAQAPPPPPPPPGVIAGIAGHSVTSVGNEFRTFLVATSCSSATPVGRCNEIGRN